MNAALEKVLYHLTQKSNLTDISVDDLSHLAKNYPFFAPAQLALAVKLKQNNDFESQTQLGLNCGLIYRALFSKKPIFIVLILE